MPDVWSLYELMIRSRLFEEAIAELWHEGLISGEMHLGTGEEAIIAGVVSQLREGDALALDHRGTAAMLMRGVDPALILRELLGQPDGLCGGMGGHMHLFSKEHLIASSGIVGASGPAAAGFAMAAQYLRPGTIAVAFFGEGAMNQGMLMESLNLASEWKLPVLFVCKDDGWAITTQSDEAFGQSLIERSRGLGVPAIEVEGFHVAEVWEAANSAIERGRSGKGPTFLHCRCVHLEAHFLGFQLLRVLRQPFKELPKIALPMTRSFLQPDGASLSERMAGLKQVLGALRSTNWDPRKDLTRDPIWRTRRSLQDEPGRLAKVEAAVEREMGQVVAAVIREANA